MIKLDITYSPNRLILTVIQDNNLVKYENIPTKIYRTSDFSGPPPSFGIRAMIDIKNIDIDIRHSDRSLDINIKQENPLENFDNITHILSCNENFKEIDQDLED